MSQPIFRRHIAAVLAARTDDDPARRAEAIFEYLQAMRPDLTEAQAKAVSEKTPPLTPALHRRWIALFITRLFETVPDSQLELLCDGSDDNNAAIALAYVMFLESERMERVMAEDLRNCALAACSDDAALSGALAGLADELARLEVKSARKREEKAKAYKRS